MKTNKRKIDKNIEKQLDESEDQIQTESESNSIDLNEDNEDIDNNYNQNDINHTEEDNKDNKRDNMKKRSNKRMKTNRSTAEELNNLRETENLLDSNLFRLQLSQMLSQMSVKWKQLNQMENWLKRFQSLLISLKSGKCYQLTDQLWCKSAKVPIIQEPFEVKGMFCFSAPKVFKLIGSYDLGTAIGTEIVVDFAVEMGSDCWQRHDNLNHRYQRKRALYLCHISQQIKSSELIQDMRFTYWNGNHSRPILLITPKGPKGKLSKHFRLALTAYPESDQKVFRWTRFTPEKNNIRSDWLQMNGSQDWQDLPTPTYNSNIQNDLNLISNYEYLSKRVKQCVPLKDCLILLKIWLKQRQLKSEFNFILSLFVCYVIEKHQMIANSSCYQIFRNTLLLIADSKWDTEGIALNDNLWQPLDLYLTYFPVVFIDVSGYHNLCWNISIDSYDRLRHESRLTIDCLDSNQKNSFDCTFMKAITFESKFDLLLKLSVPSLLSSSKVSSIRNDIIDLCGDTVNAFVAHLIPLCKRVVGQRALLVEHQSNADNRIEWALDELPPHPNDRHWLTFGFIINAEKAYNKIERGPEADSPEALDFREFWGKKSELRRFEDNSICETVYWDSKSLSQKRQIISRSLEFILTNILNIPIDSVFTTISLLDPMVELKNLRFEKENRVYGTGEEIAISISHKFDGLAKKLRALEGLPLVVTTVHSIDPVLRGTEVFPPLAMNSGKIRNFINDCNVFDLSVEQRVPKYFKPLQVIIQLEGSGKWPNSLDAFYRVKASFHLELSKRLSAQFGLICYATQHFVDVFEEGLVFRISIESHKQLVLLRQIKTSEGLIKHIESEIADNLETKLEVLPKINSALSALSRTHLCFGISCRLAKRWISSQMLSFYLDDMAIDLMIAYIFLSPTPYSVPNSPVTGFIRFLSLICDQNWKISPLIVDLNNELNSEIVQQISEKFTKERPKYPAMFITTSYDKQLSKWTTNWPDSVILNRLIVLANAAKRSLIEMIENPIKTDLKLIFRPDLDIYDLIIRLKSDQITNQIQSMDFPEKYQLLVKDFDPKVNNRMPVIDFDPIKQFVDYLRESYSHFALFFYDKFGGRHIGVIWKPSVFVSKEFKTRLVNGIVLSSTTNIKRTQNIVTNIKALIEDFSIVGEAIVDHIDVQTHNWPNN